jgi:hypothetical protein
MSDDVRRIVNGGRLRLGGEEIAKQNGPLSGNPEKENWKGYCARNIRSMRVADGSVGRYDYGRCRNQREAEEGGFRKDGCYIHLAGDHRGSGVAVVQCRHSGSVDALIASIL